MTHRPSFLSPLRSSTALWNKTRVINADLLQANTDSFLPNTDNAVVPDKVLCMFVKGKANVFLAGTIMLSKFESDDRSREAEEVVQRLNTFCGIFGFDKDGKRELKKRSTFLNCLWFGTQVPPLV